MVSEAAGMATDEPMTIRAAKKSYKLVKRDRNFFVDVNQRRKQMSRKQKKSVKS